MGDVQMRNMMTDLKLEGMLSALDRSLKEAERSSWTATDLLDHLLQAEYEWREGKSAERRVKASKLTRLPSLDDFDFTAKRSITKTQVKELYAMRWLEQGRPLVLSGPTGVGKTFIAEALGHHACQRKKSVLFMAMSDLLEHQSTARAASGYLKLRARLTKPDVLILDDFGLRKLTTTEAHDFCEILKERIGTKATIITTQLPLDHWPEVLEDPVIADTIIDRIGHVGLKFTMNGESYRKIQGQQLDKRKE